MAEAISELGEGCKEAKVGEEMIVNIMLQYRGAILNHIIENSAQFETDVYEGNWDMFNNLMQLHKVEKTFYVFVYSKTSDSGFVNLQAMRNIFIAAWKVLDKEGNIQWQETIGGDKDDNLFALTQTNDGGYIIGGNSNSGATHSKTKSNKYWLFCIFL